MVTAAWKAVDGVQFYRQKPIGEYIVDFHAPRVKLVVEADGSQHFDVEHMGRDAERDARLNGLGLRVIRFNNLEVLEHPDEVVEEVLRVMEAFFKGGEPCSEDVLISLVVFWVLTKSRARKWVCDSKWNFGRSGNHFLA